MKNSVRVQNKKEELTYLDLTNYEDETLNGIFFKGNLIYGVGFYSYRKDTYGILHVYGVKSVMKDGMRVDLFDLMRPWIGKGSGKTKGRHMEQLNFSDSKAQAIFKKYEVQETGKKMWFSDGIYPTLDKVYLDNFLNYFKLDTDVNLTLKGNTIELKGKRFMTTDMEFIINHNCDLSKLKVMDNARGRALEAILAGLAKEESIKAYSKDGILTVVVNGDEFTFNIQQEETLEEA